MSGRRRSQINGEGAALASSPSWRAIVLTAGWAQSGDVLRLTPMKGKARSPLPWMPIGRFAVGSVFAADPPRSRPFA